MGYDKNNGKTVTRAIKGTRRPSRASTKVRSEEKRAAKKVRRTKKVVKWVNVYKNGLGGVYSSKRDADMFADKKGRIVCLRLEGEYEVKG